MVTLWRITWLPFDYGLKIMESIPSAAQLYSYSIIQTQGKLKVINSGGEYTQNKMFFSEIAFERQSEQKAITNKKVPY